jgi:hypothetical protein
MFKKLKKWPYLAIFSCILIAMFCNPLSAETEEMQIRLGSHYNTLTAKLGTPIKQEVTNSFFGNKRALYKIDEIQYCIIDYRFNRAKNILFLEQISEKQAIDKFYKSETIKK